ncbi:MAG: DUF1570 domain-containing protein [Planctomycetota bacterium]|nr:MAG: DUF1570 domain-containing protein [Planctomycetota bacterium]
MRLRYALILAAVLGALASARADVIHLVDGGKHRGTIIKETRRKVVIETAVGPVTVSRDDIVEIVREQDPRSEFLRRLKKLREKTPDDADAWFELGRWASERGLERDARRCHRRAVKLDAFHEGAHRALGHKLYQGRWYTPADYERVSRGLVRHDGRWVTPEEKARLEREKTSAAPPVPASSSGSAGRALRPAAPRRPTPAGAPRAPRKAAPASGEDTAWYRDNTKVCEFADAPVYESKHYEIKTNVKPEYAERYGRMMDRYYRRFLKVFRDFLPKGELPKGTIWIYSSRAEFQRHERVGPTTGGFYQTGLRRVTAFHGPFGNTGTTREVLAHEGTHQFEDFVLGGRGFSNAPIWILEGLAVLFESAVYDGKEVIVGLVPRDRLASLKRGLAAGTLIPLDRLIRTPQPSFTAYHYAHAWSLIYMILYSSESKAVRKKTQQWFADLFMLSRTRRVTPEDVIERCGGPEGFAALEERWKNFIRDLPYDYDPRRR